MSMALLTERERQVAATLTRGMTNKEIAIELNISYETVKEHVQHILRKFGVDRRELVIVSLMKDTAIVAAIGGEFLIEVDKALVDAQRFVVCAVQENVNIPGFDPTQHVTWQHLQSVRDRLVAAMVASKGSNCGGECMARRNAVTTRRSGLRQPPAMDSNDQSSAAVL